MNSLRRWLYKPKKTDRSLLAQFYYADEELNMVAAELDSFDGRKDPERCTLLVNQLRGCQDKVLNIIQKIMDQAIDVERANRDFRVKFPDDVLQESLAGQLWFGAECLAAGSTIMNREVESASMRPLARALTKNLDSLRSILREQCLKNINSYTERILANPFSSLLQVYNLYGKIKEALTIFDKLFAEFELSYVSAMVPVKTMREYDILQEVTVLFSETVHRALRLGLLTQDMIDDYDPALMFTIPRLAIVCGLLVYPEGPLNPDMETSNMSEMFRPFQPLLYKIRELLYTLSRDELFTLEKALCSTDEPNLSSPLSNPNGMDSQSQVSCQTEKAASGEARFLNISSLTPAIYQESGACQQDILVHSPNSGSPVTPDSDGEFSIGQMSHSPSVVTIILKGSPASDRRTVDSIEISSHSSLNKCASKDSGISSENISTSGSLNNHMSSCDDDERISIVDSVTNSSGSSSSSNNIPDKDANNACAAQANNDPEVFEAAGVEAKSLSSPQPSPGSQKKHKFSRHLHNYNSQSTSSPPSSSPPPFPSGRHLQQQQREVAHCNPPSPLPTESQAVCHEVISELIDSAVQSLPSLLVVSPSSQPTVSPSSQPAQLPPADCTMEEIPNIMTQSWQYDIQFEIPRISIQPSSSVEDMDTNEGESKQKQDVPVAPKPSLNQTHNQQQHHRHHHHHHPRQALNPSHDTSASLRDRSESTETIRPPSDFIEGCRHSSSESVNSMQNIKNKDKVVGRSNHGPSESECKATSKMDRISSAMNACALEKFHQHKAGNSYRGGSGTVVHDDTDACLDIPRIQRLRYTESISSTCSSCRSGCSVGSDCEWDRESCASSETSSYNSDCHDDEEIALAIQAAELASRNEARSRFQNSTDLIHRLFVCISGVADQLQTNFASDLRSILKAVFDINCSEPLVMADNAVESSDLHYSTSHAMGQMSIPRRIAASSPSGSQTPPLRSHSSSSDDEQNLDQYARSRTFQEPPPWVPDEQSPHCSSCKAPFTFVKRRHHCRNCGKVYCSRCSSNSVPLPQYGHVKPVRVCNHCFVFQVTHFTVQDE